MNADEGNFPDSMSSPGDATNALDRMLREYARFRGLHGGDVVPFVRGWLDAAERLVLDGRADARSALELVLAAGGAALEVVDRHPPATARTVLSVLAGWRADGMPRTGQAASEPASGSDGWRWDGVDPNGWCVPLAVFHAAAADRLGLPSTTVFDWAKCGIIDVTNAPTVPDVFDPSDPDQDLDFLIEDPSQDEDYRELAAWTAEVGQGEAPLWHGAGYRADDAAFLSALPDSDHRKPSERELRLRALPRRPRPGPPG